MNKHLKELYSPSIDGIELPLVKTKIFSLEEKKAEMESLLTGNKLLAISLGLSREMCIRDSVKYIFFKIFPRNIW